MIHTYFNTSNVTIQRGDGFMNIPDGVEFQYI